MSDQAAVTTEAQIIERTRAYVRENFLYMRPDWKLQDDDALIGSGVIDSIGVVELIAFLQDTFGVTIADEDITEQHLGSLVAIGRFVHGQCHGNGAGGGGPPSRGVA
jgi:acyl carrier protein